MLHILTQDSDWRLWRELRLAALADAPAAFPGAAAAWDRGGEQRWRGWLTDPNALAVVALDAETPIGLVRGLVEPDAAWLYSLWVSSGHRRGGTARQLIGAVVRWAETRSHLLRLSVVPDNTPAIHLYRRLGFIPAALIGDPTPSGERELVFELTLPSGRPPDQAPAGSPRSWPT